MDELIEYIKTLLAMVVTWMTGQFIDNPIGTLASIVGLLYVYEKWRAQRIDRKQKERDYERDTRPVQERKEGA